MSQPINNTILAYLLALSDFSGTLSEQEKNTLKIVAKDLDLSPKSWESHIKPFLLQTIKGNTQLDQSYSSYKEKLDKLSEIPLDLLPQMGEINQLLESNLSPKGPFGVNSDAPALGYEQQLNNVVILVNQTEHPEATVKKLSFLDKMKQYLGQHSQ